MEAATVGMALAVDVAGGAVDGDVVALVVVLAAEGEVLLASSCIVDLAAAGDAAGAHAAGNNGGVGGHAAADGQDALGGSHALDVLGGGLAGGRERPFRRCRPRPWRPRR